MKHRKIADEASAVSSIHSNVTRALRVKMPTKSKRSLVPAPPQPPSEILSDFAPPMELPVTSIVIAEPPSRSKRKAATKASAAIQPLKRKKSPSRKKRRQLIKQTQIKIKSIASSIKKVAAQSQDVETDYTVGQFSPVPTFLTQYYISPNYEGPETSMTVGEAKRLYKSESD